MSATPATALTRTGNTIEEDLFARKPGKSLRSVFLTENQHCNATLDELRNLNCQYIVFQTEIGPKNGKLHYHATIKFKNSKRWSTLKKLFPRANIKAVRNFTKAREYCLKEPSFNGTRYERNGSNVITDVREEYIKTVIKPPRDREAMVRELLTEIQQDEKMNFWFRKYFRNSVPLI